MELVKGSGTHLFFNNIKAFRGLVDPASLPSHYLLHTPLYLSDQASPPSPVLSGGLEGREGTPVTWGDAVCGIIPVLKKVAGARPGGSSRNLNGAQSLEAENSQKARDERWAECIFWFGCLR